MKLSKWLFIISVCLWTGGQGPKEPPVEIMAVSIQEHSLKPMYHIDDFDCASILIELFKSNGDKEIVPLDTSMIEIADHPKLSKAGSHVLSVDVLGAETVLPINLYQTEYDYQLLSLYINGIQQSSIGDISYSEWLLSIAGEPGISLASSQVNDDGHLILTLTDGSTHDAGYILGEDGTDGLDGLDGTDGLSIELDVQDNWINWRHEGLAWTPLIALHDLRGSRGFTGAKGSDGVGITETTVSETGGLIIHYSDGRSEEIGPLFEQYMVLFKDVHGSIIDVQSVKHGGSINAPMPPDLEGHTFIRWSTSIEEVTSHEVITPIYERKVLNVSFDSTGGNQIQSIQTPYDSTISLETPVKEGYQFVGWYVSESDHAERFSNQTHVSSDITLYARWSRPVYTVVFNDVDGTPIKIGYTYPDGNITPPKVRNVSGYAFTGWTHTSHGINSDLIIDPVYELTYTMSYYVLDGDYSDQTFTLNEEESISSAAVGSAHSGLITNQGRLFMWGDNSSYQFGLEDSNKQYEPTLINPYLNLDENERVKSLALGDSHTLILTNVGRLIAFGSNQHGQLGIGITSPAMPAQDVSLNFLAEGDTLTNIASGSHHSGILTDNGHVYLFGSNAFNQITRDETDYYTRPKHMRLRYEMDYGDRVKTLVMGDTHNAVLTNFNRIIMWGDNTDKKISYFDPDPFKIISPSLATDEFIVQLTLGTNHNGFLTSQGRVFTWGVNSKGQLGTENTSIKYSPTHISIQDASITSIEFGPEVSYMISDTNKVYATGHTNDGLILGDALSNLYSFTDLTNYYENAGWNHSSHMVLGSTSENTHAFIIDEESLIGFGINTYGQLGSSDSSLNMYEITSHSIEPIHTETRISQSNDDLWVYSNEEGQTITQWYTDLACTEPYIKGPMPAEDLMLYGKIE